MRDAITAKFTRLMLNDLSPWMLKLWWRVWKLSFRKYIIYLPCRAVSWCLVWICKHNSFSQELTITKTLSYMISCIACKYIDNDCRETNMVLRGVLHDNSCSFYTHVVHASATLGSVPRVATIRWLGGILSVQAQSLCCKHSQPRTFITI